MPPRLRSRPALLCALALAVAVLLTHPVAEIGINDDWSYIYSARHLAQTGHIAFFGWTTPMLGWQLYLGALFIRLFGFSFTATRAPIFLIAILTAWLLHRCFTRAGCTARNATLATLTLLLTPLFLPLAFSFMSDVGGLFSIVLCLYACLRATQAPTDRAAFRWLLFAALSGVLTGTVRQIAWLGVLVMVPSTGWLLRHRIPRLAAVAVYVLCTAMVFGLLHWFSLQPYTQTEGALSFYPDREALSNIIRGFTHGFLELAFYALPLLLAFARPPARTRPTRVALLATPLLLGLAAILLHPHTAEAANWLAPFGSGYVTNRGLLQIGAIAGTAPLILPLSLNLLLTALTFAALISLGTWLLTPAPTSPNAKPPASSPRPTPTTPARTNTTPDPTPSLKTLAILLLPFTAATLALLIPRAATNQLNDRYVFTFLLVAFLFLIRLYQSRIAPQLPAICVGALAIVALVAIAATHDLFAMERARLQLIDELHHAGLPDTAFFGGYEYDGWTQITLGGHINSHRILHPADAFRDPGPFLASHPCGYPFSHLYPALNPHYILSYNPNTCAGPTPIDPITFPTWLPPFHTTLYVNRIGFPALFEQRSQEQGRKQDQTGHSIGG